MKKIFGTFCCLLALLMFFVAMTKTVTLTDSFSIGYSIGIHLPWILVAMLAYRLLKAD